VAGVSAGASAAAWVRRVRRAAKGAERTALALAPRVARDETWGEAKAGTAADTAKADMIIRSA